MHLKRNFNFLQSPGLRFRAVHTEEVCREGGGGNVQQAANQRQQDHHQVKIWALSPFSVMEQFHIRWGKSQGKTAGPSDTGVGQV